MQPTDSTDPVSGLPPARATPRLRRYLRDALPWVPLVRETPVELARETSSCRLWLKRDDLTHSAYGGNKVRKLALVLGEALDAGRSRISTIGAVGSNHCLATAIHGTSLGLRVEALHVAQPVTSHVLETCRAFFGAGGVAELVGPVSLPTAVVRDRLAAWLATGERRVTFVPAGGSSPLGTLGHVEAALELASQIRRGVCPMPRSIVVTAGTCGTVVGLRIGLALAGLSNVRLIGVRVVDRAMCNAVRNRRLAALATNELRRRGGDAPAWNEVELELEHGAFGAGYGTATTRAERALAEAEALGLPSAEVTYTGKTLGEVLDRMDDGRLTGEVLYWHTLNSAPIDGWSSLRPIDTLPAPYGDLFAAAR